MVLFGRPLVSRDVVFCVQRLRRRSCVCLTRWRDIEYTLGVELLRRVRGKVRFVEAAIYRADGPEEIKVFRRNRVLIADEFILRFLGWSEYDLRSMFVEMEWISVVGSGEDIFQRHLYDIGGQTVRMTHGAACRWNRGEPTEGDLERSEVVYRLPRKKRADIFQLAAVYSGRERNRIITRWLFWREAKLICQCEECVRNREVYSDSLPGHQP